MSHTNLEDLLRSCITLLGRHSSTDFESAARVVVFYFSGFLKLLNTKNIIQRMRKLGSRNHKKTNQNIIYWTEETVVQQVRL